MRPEELVILSHICILSVLERLFTDDCSKKLGWWSSSEKNWPGACGRAKSSLCALDLARMFVRQK